MIGPDCAAEGPSKGTLDSLMVSLLLARGGRRGDDGGGRGGRGRLAEEHATIEDDREVPRLGSRGLLRSQLEAGHQERAANGLELAHELLQLEVAAGDVERQRHL